MTAHRFDAVRTSPFYRSEHEAFRQSLRKFVAREIEPFANDWDEAGEFPRELYKKAAKVGYMGLGFPERYGGTEGDRFMRIIAMQEIGRAGCGGVAAGLFSHTIGAPPILHRGSEAMKARVLPQVLSGEKISALAITEPSGGSDVANLRSTARRDADHYVLNGSKTFITSGMRADFITLAAAPAAQARAASASSWSKATRKGCSARRSRRWVGGARTQRRSASTTAACRPRT